MGREVSPPFWGEGAGSLPNIKSSGLRPTSMPTAILIHPAIWHNKHTKWHLDASSRLATIIKGWKLGLALSLLGEGELGPNNVAWAKTHFHAKCHLDRSSRWRQRTCAENWGEGSSPFLGSEALGAHLTQCSLGRGLPRINWQHDPCSRLAAIDMGRKLGGFRPLFG